MRRLGWVGWACLLLWGAMQSAVALPTPSPSATWRAPERLSHGRFHDLAIYRPRGDVEQVVLFLSGGDGWTEALHGLAHALSQTGTLVAGIDLPSLSAQLEQDDADCVFPDGDLENLGRFLQAYYRRPVYRPVVLVGYGTGAPFVYAMLAQAPRGSFSGGVSLGFRPVLHLRKPLCAAGHLRFGNRLGQTGVELLPARTLETPWIVVQTPETRNRDLQRFVSTLDDATVVPGPGGVWECEADRGRDDGVRDGRGDGLCDDDGHGRNEGNGNGNGLSEGVQAGEILRQALQRIAASHPAVVQTASTALRDLPLIEVPAGKANSTDQLAVILSGDGGWAGIDKQIAAGLAARGVAVVGLDSLRYFWEKRTPQGTAADVDRILRHYLATWGKRHALLIGYSQGADVLPFILNRLPTQTRDSLSLVVLIGAGRSATFEFHLSDWLGAKDDGLPILPEFARAGPDATTAPEPVWGASVLCLYGQDEDPQQTLCPNLPPGVVERVKLPGGHHFDGDYRRLVALILGRLHH